MRYIGAALVALLLCSSAARADDFGPAKDVRDIGVAAKRLLAHRIRPLEPSAITITDTVVVKDQALLTWRAGSQIALMGMVRYADRWWDAFDENAPPSCPSPQSAFPLKPYSVFDLDTAPNLSDLGFTGELVRAAQSHNASLTAISGPRRMMCDDITYEPFPAKLLDAGGIGRTIRSETGGYDMTLRYAANDAAPGTKLTSLRARAPSPGEFLAQSPPFAGDAYGTSVVFLYVDTDAKKPVAFQKGGSLDIWVPWMLDDTLHYELEFYEGKTVVGPIKATLHDNVLHFDLPAFALPPGETLGEVDGYF